MQPTAKIKYKVLEFKNKYPKQIQFYQSGHRKMHYAWSGDPSNRPLVFVHGSPGDWTGWAEFLLNSELQNNFQIISIDRPGYGKSEPRNTERSLSVQAANVAQVLSVNKSGKKAILVGHSYGGAVIAQIAADWPEKVAGLVFVASSVDPNLEEIRWIQYPASWWPIRSLIPRSLRVCNEEIFALKNELEALADRWSNISAVVAIIQGGADTLVPAANQKFIASKISLEKIKYSKVVPKMNHFVPWQHPELILSAIATLEGDKALD